MSSSSETSSEYTTAGSSSRSERRRCSESATSGPVGLSPGDVGEVEHPHVARGRAAVPRLPGLRSAGCASGHRRGMHLEPADLPAGRHGAPRRDRRRALLERPPEAGELGDAADELGKLGRRAADQRRPTRSCMRRASCSLTCRIGRPGAHASTTTTPSGDVSAVRVACIPAGDSIASRPGRGEVGTGRFDTRFPGEVSSVAGRACRARARTARRPGPARADRRSRRARRRGRAAARRSVSPAGPGSAAQPPSRRSLLGQRGSDRPRGRRVVADPMRLGAAGFVAHLVVGAVRIETCLARARRRSTDVRNAAYSSTAVRARDPLLDARGEVDRDHHPRRRTPRSHPRADRRPGCGQSSAPMGRGRAEDATTWWVVDAVGHDLAAEGQERVVDLEAVGRPDRSPAERAGEAARGGARHVDDRALAPTERRQCWTISGRSARASAGRAGPR